MNIPITQPLPLLDIDVLRAFIAIAETKSFTAAAELVFRTPSAVSMQIKKLEAQLECSLFIRDSRSVALTAKGEQLLPYARRILAMNREAVAQFVVPDVKGVVRFGAADGSDGFLPAILKLFKQSHPAISVDVIIERSEDLLKRMQAGELDVMVANRALDKTPEGGETIVRTRLYWAGKAGGQAHLCNPLPISVWESGCAWREIALSALDENAINYHIAFMSAYVAGQRAAVLADLAIAPLPLDAIDKNMRILGTDQGLPKLDIEYQIAMVVRENGGDAVEAFADHIRSSMCKCMEECYSVEKRVAS